MAARGVIRRLWAVERAKVRDHLLRLEPEDRQRRFGGSVTDSHIETYCAGLDWRRGVVLGYVEGGEVRAVGELMPLGAAPPGAAEAALSVEQPFQDRGIGTELLRRLIVIARNRSIGLLHARCVMENGKVLRMTRKLGARLRFEQGEVEARLPLSWPNQATLLLELLDGADAVLALLRPVEASKAIGLGGGPSRGERGHPPGRGARTVSDRARSEPDRPWTRSAVPEPRRSRRRSGRRP